MTSRKIVYASAIMVEEFRTEVDELLRHIAQLLKDPDESEDHWLGYVFVSDESRIADFISSELELQALRVRLAVPELNRQDFICAIALAIRKKRAPHTVN